MNDIRTELLAILASLRVQGMSVWVVSEFPRDDIIGLVSSVLPPAQNFYEKINPQAAPICYREDDLYLELLRSVQAYTFDNNDNEAVKIVDKVRSVMKGRFNTWFCNAGMAVDPENKNAQLEYLYIWGNNDKFVIVYFWTDV